MDNVFLDPITDFGFKRIFGSDANKELLISFLNALFRGRKRIQYLFNEKELIPDPDDEGTVVFDLTCATDKGEHIIVRMQTTRQSNLKNRMLYDGSKLIVNQVPLGNRKGWSYQMSEVYVVLLTDELAWSDRKNETGFLHDISLCDRDSGVKFSSGLSYIYVELGNFTKNEADLKNSLDQWLYVLKNVSKMDRLPIYLPKPVFEKLFDIARYDHLNTKERELYNDSLKRKWTADAVRRSHREELESAREQGKQDGKDEERVLTARQHALKMKKNDIETDLIAEITTLSPQEIEKL